VNFGIVKKAALGAVVTGASLATCCALALPASAATTGRAGSYGDGGTGSSFLNNLCAAPWQWNGPGEALTLGHMAVYAACNGNKVSSAGSGQGASFLNNLCAAPWQWNGPGEAFTAQHTADYTACNGNSS
jgi:hypothetical protein